MASSFHSRLLANYPEFTAIAHLFLFGDANATFYDRPGRQFAMASLELGGFSENILDRAEGRAGVLNLIRL